MLLVAGVATGRAGRDGAVVVGGRDIGCDGVRGGTRDAVVAVRRVPPGYSRSRCPGWMTYGGGTSFHIARSSGLMPLLTAMRYSVSPRLTMVLAPYFGADTRATGRVPPSRITRLLPQAASDATTTSKRNIRRASLMARIM